MRRRVFFRAGVLLGVLALALAPGRGASVSSSGPLGGDSLSVDPQNPALRLYERVGFTRVPSRDDHWTMVLDLAG